MKVSRKFASVAALACSLIAFDSLSAKLFDFSNPVAALSIRAEPISMPVEYRAGLTCRFTAKFYDGSKKIAQFPFEIQTRSVKDSIQIIHTHLETGQRSSVLVSKNGRLIDYNFASGSSPRITPESESRQPSWSPAPAYLHPHFNGRDPSPGSFYGVVQGSDKRTSATLLYRGKASFAYRTALVFDIMGLERSAGAPNGVPEGRLVIDEADGFPRALVLGFNRRAQYERSNCTTS